MIESIGGMRTEIPIINPRADLYHALAEALAEPPEWLVFPGKAWPLFESATQLGQCSQAAQQAVLALGEIGAESLSRRKARYENLFIGSGRPKFDLYESMYSSGRLFGPETLAVERVYKSAGIETVSPELPDHASVELAFLAHIAEQQFLQPEQASLWVKLERRFIRQHAGRWLPNLGHRLARSGDDVYAPIGKLLAGWLEETMRPTVRSALRARLPVIDQPDNCTLCGFCIQVCPTSALAMRETADQTALWLSPASCVGCAKCATVCQNMAIEMQSYQAENLSVENWQLLRHARRARCDLCNSPTVSQAELDFVRRQIGDHPWLSTCHSCRAQEMENL